MLSRTPIFFRHRLRCWLNCAPVRPQRGTPPPHVPFSGGRPYGWPAVHRKSSTASSRARRGRCGQHPSAWRNFTDPWSMHCNREMFLFRRTWRRVEALGPEVAEEWMSGVGSEKEWTMDRLAEWGRQQEHEDASCSLCDFEYQTLLYHLTFEATNSCCTVSLLAPY